jgi:hypothetical protein
MPHPGRPAHHGEHLLDVLREQAFAQSALADHAGRTEDDDLHFPSFVIRMRTPIILARTVRAVITAA